MENKETILRSIKKDLITIRERLRHMFSADYFDPDETELLDSFEIDEFVEDLSDLKKTPLVWYKNVNRILDYIAYELDARSKQVIGEGSLKLEIIIDELHYVYGSHDSLNGLFGLPDPDDLSCSLSQLLGINLNYNSDAYESDPLIFKISNLSDHEDGSYEITLEITLFQSTHHGRF